jgi:hypothetical protein
MNKPGLIICAAFFLLLTAMVFVLNALSFQPGPAYAEDMLYENPAEMDVESEVTSGMDHVIDSFN